MSFTRTDSYYTNEKRAKKDIIKPGVVYVIKQAMKLHIDNANNIYNKIKKYNLENSQEFINWQDSLNEISVR